MDRYLLETSSVDGYLLEDGSGVLLLENQQEPAVGQPYVKRCGGIPGMAPNKGIW